MDWCKLEFSVCMAVFYAIATFDGDSVWRHFFRGHQDRLCEKCVHTCWEKRVSVE